MSDPEITFNEDGDVVSVWIARFASRGALDDYLAAFYSDSPDTDDLPLSGFGTDIGLTYYEEECLEHAFLDTETTDLGSALASASYSESFAEAVAAASADAKPFNTVILLYGYAHARYPQADHRSEHVQFLGTFAYERES